MPETHSRNNIRIVKTEVDPEFSEFEYVEPVSIKHRGRSAGFNPANRFDKTHTKPTFEDVVEQEIRVPTQYLADASKSILAKNDSPDIPFTYSINPYRGCEHGCIYCYARPSHEYLGYSSGLDFETRILVKHDAAALLEKEFRNPRWVPEAICLSGNTDCYQPVERKLEITRSLLKVFLRYRNPVRIITKNHLVTRDLDLLSELARLNLVGALISITTLDPELAHRMEPRTSLPKKRLQTIEAMAKAGVPVGVMTAPVIPGLNDHEIPEILRMASEAGATSAGYTVVRLTHSLKELFKDWLAREYPARSEKVIHSIEDTRHG
ncbi:MAG: PA0069 family radical SAM protein, partial [Bacteroidetes bacterium]|nr:PA0069 family radical SAM protein [Bacteroidota bacterium]